MRGGGRGEGPAQFFSPLFTNCIYWVNLGMRREGETPAQNLWHIDVQRMWYKLSKFGGGDEVIWTKSERTATFSGNLPSCKKCDNANSTDVIVISVKGAAKVHVT